MIPNTNFAVEFFPELLNAAVDIRRRVKERDLYGGRITSNQMGEVDKTRSREGQRVNIGRSRKDDFPCQHNRIVFDIFGPAANRHDYLGSERARMIGTGARARESDLGAADTSKRTGTTT